MKSLIALLLCVAATGCATKYTPPESGEKSKIRIEASQFASLSSMRAVYYKNGSCDEPYVLGFISGISTTESDPGADTPGNKNLKSGTYFERIISSHDETNITMQGHIFGSICSIPFSFSAKPDENYRLHYFWQGSKCHITIERLILNDKGIEFLPIEVQAQKSPCATGF